MTEPELGMTMVNDHMKAMWAGQSNVLVAVRVRPLLKHDRIAKGCVKVLQKVIIVEDPARGDKADVLRANRSKEKQYAFDFAFGPSSGQEEVYDCTTKFLIHGVLDGFNGTVFCYGMTGAGKTYTMIGADSDPGIMVRVMSDLFLSTRAKSKKQGMIFKVTVSFLEVYNEMIRDLLSEADDYLDLREDPIKGPMVAGITETEAFSGSEVMGLLKQGNSRRTQHATAANETSSRSHAVLQVLVEGKDRAPGTVSKVKVGKLSLVDLAGSERASNTKNTGIRLVEGANINKSLLALGNCINALGEKGNTKGNFVPYRDSKLTRLLKDSLGGNCRTVMIANISSAESCYEETLNTLKYANRAKNIKTTVQRNELDVNYHISEYENLIANLRNEIKLLKDEMIQRRGPSALGNSVQGKLAVGDVSDGSEWGGRGREGDQFAGAGLGIGIGLGSPLPLRSPSAVNVRPFGGHASDALSSLMSSGSVDRVDNVKRLRQAIVDNFQEKIQLRRSLIELDDHNVQNGIEISKRQLIVMNWYEDQYHSALSETPGRTNSPEMSNLLLSAQPSGDGLAEDLDSAVMQSADAEVKEAWLECAKLRKAMKKNNVTKGLILQRVRNNEDEAEEIRAEITSKVAGADRLDLMELQYQVGRLELEKMELEQTTIVHDSIVKGKDLLIQKLKLQLAMKDKLIQRQKTVLTRNNLDSQVGYSKFAVLERALQSQEGPLSSNTLSSVNTPIAVSAEGDGSNAKVPRRSRRNKPSGMEIMQMAGKMSALAEVDDEDDADADTEGENDSTLGGHGASQPSPLRHVVDKDASSPRNRPTLSIAVSGGGFSDNMRKAPSISSPHRMATLGMQLSPKPTVRVGPAGLHSPVGLHFYREGGFGGGSGVESTNRNSSPRLGGHDNLLHRNDIIVPGLSSNRSHRDHIDAKNVQHDNGDHPSQGNANVKDKDGGVDGASVLRKARARRLRSDKDKDRERDRKRDSDESLHTDDDDESYGHGGVIRGGGTQLDLPAPNVPIPVPGAVPVPQPRIEGKRGAGAQLAGRQHAGDIESTSKALVPTPKDVAKDIADNSYLNALHPSGVSRQPRRMASNVGGQRKSSVEIIPEQTNQAQGYGSVRSGGVGVLKQGINKQSELRMQQPHGGPQQSRPLDRLNGVAIYPEAAVNDSLEDSDDSFANMSSGDVELSLSGDAIRVSDGPPARRAHGALGLGIAAHKQPRSHNNPNNGISNAAIENEPLSGLQLQGNSVGGRGAKGAAGGVSSVPAPAQAQALMPSSAFNAKQNRMMKYPLRVVEKDKDKERADGSSAAPSSLQIQGVGRPY